MPPRLVVGFIVAGWLATMGWFCYREWLQNLQSDGDAPFSIDLADEASPQIANWTLYQGEEKIGSATSRMSYQKDDTFEMVNSMHGLQFKIDLRGSSIPIKVPLLTTTQRVTREGKLLSLESQVKIAILGIEVSSEMSGVVKDGKLFPVVSVDALFLHLKQRALPPVEIKSQSMWNPMQPHAKIRVKPGQRWRMAAIDPLGDALAGSLPQLGRGIQADMGQEMETPTNIGFRGPKILHAEVLREPQELSYASKVVLCYVIEYRDADDITQKLVARTWIQVSDAKVLRQEATLLQDQLILQREE